MSTVKLLLGVKMQMAFLLCLLFYLVLRLFIIGGNVPAFGEVANFGTDYFLLKIKFLTKCKREFTTKFAILPNACYGHVDFVRRL